MVLMLMPILIAVTTGDDRPALTDLLSNVVEQCAAYWEKLASLLGLKDYQIASISKNNEYNPNRAVACCRAVLEKWLKEIPSPTWGKLEDSVKELSLRKASCDTMGMLYI